MPKAVSIIGHKFDCLPGHVTISARGSGSNLRVAVQKAIKTLLWDKRLHRKHIGTFSVSVVVVSDKAEAQPDA